MADGSRSRSGECAARPPGSGVGVRDRRVWTRRTSGWKIRQPCPRLSGLGRGCRWEGRNLAKRALRTTASRMPGGGGWPRCAAGRIWTRPEAISVTASRWCRARTDPPPRLARTSSAAALSTWLAKCFVRIPGSTRKRSCSSASAKCAWRVRSSTGHEGHVVIHQGLLRDLAHPGQPRDHVQAQDIRLAFLQRGVGLLEGPPARTARRRLCA